MSGLARRLLAVWRSLSPKERKAISRAWNLLVTVVVGIAAQRMVQRLVISSVLVGAGAGATVGVTSVADGDSFRPMAHANLSAELAPGTPVAEDPVVLAAALEASQAAAEETTSGPDQVLEPRTLAAPEQHGCKTDPVRNWSSRNGARPALGVVHYTVSRNQSGWDDVDAIRDYFDQSRSQASSHFVIDFEGHCAYIVHTARKAWTQGWFNPWSISIEFIAKGDERVWPEAALRRGARVLADQMKQYGIPVQPAIVSGCRVVRAGIIDHEALDCGNDHTDVKPYFPMGKFIRYVREAAGPVPKPRPPSRPYRVCSWKAGAETVCANAKDAGSAVEVRLRRGHTMVSVRRR